MIKPEVGRHVHFYIPPSPIPKAAIITWVHGDRLVNLAWFQADGTPGRAVEVVLRQPGDLTPEREYCEWMPWQVKQADAERVTEEITDWGKRMAERASEYNRSVFVPRWGQGEREAHAIPGGGFPLKYGPNGLVIK